MPRAELWSQLKVGIVAAAVISAAVFGVLKFARIGALHGDTVQLYTVTDRATGVIQGTEVWLAGQKVGLVTGVDLRPPSQDTTERVAIGMKILTQYMPYLRKDSDVQIRPGGNLIGSPVVYLTVGTGRRAPVAAGDTLRARAQQENRPGVADISSLGDSVTAIASEIKQVNTDFSGTLGQVSDLRAKTQVQIGEVRNAMERFSSRATRSRGTLALAMGDSAVLRAEVARLSAITDSLRATAAGPRGGNVGRFRSDSTLVLHARHAMATADTLRSRLARYTTNPTRGDSALARQLALVHIELDSLVQDAKHHPFRYLPF